MKNYWLALAVTVGMTVSASSLNAMAANYTDVQSNWAQSDINSVVEQNVMSGFNDGLFHPEAWVTRAEFTAMTARALGLPPNQANQIQALKKVSRNSWNFSTVDNSAWLSAYPSGVYRPENPLRRVEMLVGLSGALKKPLLTTEEADQVLSQYTDADQVPTNVRQQVATAIKYNLLASDPQQGSNQIAPLRPANRAEVATVLHTLSENRDITVVQNGQVVAKSNSDSAEQTETTASSTTTNTESVTSATNADPTAATSSSASTMSSTSSTESSSSSTLANSNAYQNQTPTAAAATDETGNSQTANNQQPAASETGTRSFSPYASADQKVEGSSGPFRNSADTIVESRMVNQTPAPNNVDASVAASLPANATFVTTVAKALYSEFNKPGDPVLLIMDHALTDASNKPILPAGSKLLGFVTSVVSRNQGGDAQLGIHLSEAITPAGQRIPLSATIANADGILKAGNMEGVVSKPDHSVAALRREIHTAEGALYGTKTGKAAVLEEPYATQISDKPLDPMDKRNNDIVVGVGDQLQIRLGDASNSGNSTVSP
jgi:S-layer homology domain